MSKELFGQMRQEEIFKEELQAKAESVQLEMKENKTIIEGNLTVDHIKRRLIPGSVFAKGEGLFPGLYKERIRWIAKMGEAEDWCIYYHLADKPYDYIERSGDKVTMKENILKLVPCDEEALKYYRQ